MASGNMLLARACRVARCKASGASSANNAGYVRGCDTRRRRNFYRTTACNRLIFLAARSATTCNAAFANSTNTNTALVYFGCGQSLVAIKSCDRTTSAAACNFVG